MHLRITTYKNRSTVGSLINEMQALIDGMKTTHAKDLDKLITDVHYDNVSSAENNAVKVIFITE